MITLPHGCKCSNISVTPKNWKTGGKNLLNKNWRIYYYFYDPQFPKKPLWGKQVPIKGMNRFKTLDERREATQILIDEELYLLRVEGYNPITKKSNGPDIHVEYEIDPETPLNLAIDYARSKIHGEKSTLTDLKSCVKYFKRSCDQLRYSSLRIGEIKRVHVRNILENQRIQNDYNNERFNKVRAYMQMVFKQLVLCDAIDYNYVTDIQKRKETKKLKDTLSNEEIKIVKSHLKSNHYPFYRYTEIYFHSGSRNTELFNLKREDIDIDNQKFKVLVKKGRYFEEQWRAINNNVLNFWKELIKASDIGDYIFSYRFSPGSVKIAPRQVSNKWRKHVKLTLGITADFTSLKHLHTTKVIDLYDKNLGAGINGHKSTAMNERHYDTRNSQRIIEEAKKIDISL